MRLRSFRDDFLRNRRSGISQKQNANNACVFESGFCCPPAMKIFRNGCARRGPCVSALVGSIAMGGSGQLPWERDDGTDGFLGNLCSADAAVVATGAGADYSDDGAGVPTSMVHIE